MGVYHFNLSSYYLIKHNLFVSYRKNLFHNSLKVSWWSKLEPLPFLESSLKQELRANELHCLWIEIQSNSKSEITEEKAVWCANKECSGKTLLNCWETVELSISLTKSALVSNHAIKISIHFQDYCRIIRFTNIL